MRTTVAYACVAVLVAVCLSSVGCGRSDLPELATVEGTVTMDGQPLPGVLVQFYSEAGGRPGSGITDSQGKYELTYTAGVKGTKVGPSRIEITTVWPDGEPRPGERETIPAKYNSDSTLQEVVIAGHNTLDFPLESGRR